MPTITAGASQNITLPAGQTISFDPSGSGNAVIANGQEAGTGYQLGGAQVVIGPFTTARTISVAPASNVGYFIGAAAIDVTATRTAPGFDPSLYGDPAAAVGGARKTFGNTLSRGLWKPFGRAEATTTIASGATGATLAVCLRLPRKPIRWRWGLVNGGSTNYTVTAMGTRSVPSRTDPMGGTAAFTGIRANTFSGSAGTSVVGLGISRQANWAVTDWQSGPLVKSTDPEGGYLMTAKAQISQVASITCVGFGVDGASNNLDGWASRTGGDDIYYRAQTGDLITGSPAMSGAGLTNRAFTIFDFFEYITDEGEVHTIMVNSDSIGEGAGADLFGEGWVYVMCKQLSQTTGKAVTFANCGWSGASSAVFTANLARLLPIVGKSLALVLGECGTLNGVATVIDTNVVEQWAADRAVQYQACSDAGLALGSWSILPTPTSNKNLGATDALRIAENVRIKTANPVYFLDFEEVMGGATLSNGQRVLSDVLTKPADRVHPSKAGLTGVYDPSINGHDAMAAYAAPLVRTMMRI